MQTDSFAVAILGCRADSATLERRARAGSAAFKGRSGDGAKLALACGGRRWGGVAEADAIARILVETGVPPEAIARELCSLDTRDNARFAAALLARRGLSRVAIVTCTWHLPRATQLFEAAGLEVVAGIGVDPPSPTPRQRAYWAARELVARVAARGKPLVIA